MPPLLDLPAANLLSGAGKTRPPSLSGANAPVDNQTAGATPQPSGQTPDMNKDGTIDEADLMILEDFTKMLKSMLKKKGTTDQGPASVLGSETAVNNAELLSDKFDAPVPPFLGQ